MPAKDTVFTGDIVYVERILGVGEQRSMSGWPAAFEAVAATAVTHLVPGHGGPTTLAHARADTFDYLMNLRSQIAALNDSYGAEARAKEACIVLDTDMAGRRDAFNSAEMLLASLAACLLKGAERVVPMLNFNLRDIDINLHEIRQDRPPKMLRIDCDITVDTD